jgi:hypothetical protein
MDRLIRTAWRAFWVGLGASAVLISQSLVAPPAGPDTPADPAPVVAPLLAPAAPAAAARARSADPILSRNPFDSKAGPLSRCAVVANVKRCS